MPANVFPVIESAAKNLASMFNLFSLCRFSLSLPLRAKLCPILRVRVKENLYAACLQKACFSLT
ncbi:hypothetical protein IJT93_13260, partial [bacterium]|nr:hypothetical protein [bacterium]